MSVLSVSLKTDCLFAPYTDELDAISKCLTLILCAISIILNVPIIFEDRYFLGASKLYLTPAWAARWMIISGLKLRTFLLSFFWSSSSPLIKLKFLNFQPEDF